MQWIYAFGFTVILLSAFQQGYSHRGLVIALTSLCLLLMVWYFESRNSDKAPSAFEKGAALLWRILRMIVGVVAGLIFIAVPVFEISSKPLSVEELPRGFWLLGCLILGLYCVWVAFFGRNYGESFKSDLDLHKRNKERYRWRI